MSERDIWKSVINDINRSWSVEAAFNTSEGSDELCLTQQTTQQKKRDKSITKLLELYVNSYRNKIQYNKVMKVIIFSVMLAMIAAVTIICCIVVCISVTKDSKTIADVATLIASLVGLLALIIGVIKVITGHIFPKDDEKYISQIVELIQKNDLENRRIDVYPSGRIDFNVANKSNPKEPT